MVEFAWRGPFLSSELSALHADAFGGEGAERDWRAAVERHSLGWVTARRGDEHLIAFVNVAWDGAEHAFLLDTLVAAEFRRRGVAVTLVRQAVERARSAGCRWVHVDFEEHLTGLYLDACGFAPTAAGVVRLADYWRAADGPAGPGGLPCGGVGGPLP
jgi:GNAT superfamily N-acetyltransferase